MNVANLTRYTYAKWKKAYNQIHSIFEIFLDSIKLRLLFIIFCNLYLWVFLKKKKKIGSRALS